MTLFFIIPKLNQNEEKENNTADPQCPHQHLSHCRRAGPARQSDAPTKVGVSPPRYPGRWQTALSTPHGGFFDGRSSNQQQYITRQKKTRKKKGARKKNQPTLLRGRSGAQQPPALCPTAGLIRLLSSGKRLLAHRFSRQKDGQRAVRLSSGGVCLVPGGSRLSFLELFSHCIKWSIFFYSFPFFPFSFWSWRFFFFIRVVPLFLVHTDLGVAQHSFTFLATNF